ncbi:hypothetical protein RJ640_013962 [Escallonia rubra]|uniref:Uncharacterized protein n=1 Tax=Escallonia rubra TaxID=112253 RepID=A0AA88RDJ2_9ASTE|nr:hypothetical protein RJ640_013962 [Escallonia rubra]
MAFGLKYGTPLNRTPFHGPARYCSTEPFRITFCGYPLDTHVSVLGITRAEEPHFKASTRGNYGVAVFDRLVALSIARSTEFLDNRHK